MLLLSDRSNTLFLFSTVDPYVATHSQIPCAPLSLSLSLSPSLSEQAYIVDDSLILSGANLSEEYFVDRQDRYVLFENGGGGLVDFYADLIHTLRDDDSNEKINNGKRNGGTTTPGYYPHDLKDTVHNSDDSDAAVHIIPTFQSPHTANQPFVTKSGLTVPSDEDVITTLLQTALEESCTIRMASAYLNPTPRILDALGTNGYHSHTESTHSSPPVTFLTAAPDSHGFSPKPGVKRKGDWVPQAFTQICKDLSASQYHRNLHQHSLLWYSRPSWTFHGKGIWIYSPDGHLVAATAGSGNYGYRSYRRDMESNVALLFPQTQSTIQTALDQEWEALAQHSYVPDLQKQSDDMKVPWQIRAILPILKHVL